MGEGVGRRPQVVTSCLDGWDPDHKTIHKAERRDRLPAKEDGRGSQEKVSSRLARAGGG